MARSACILLLALVVGLAACDSISPTDDLVGVWEPVQLDVSTIVTVDRAQPLIDPSGPTTGELRVTGDDPVSFSEFSYGLRYPDETSLGFVASGPDYSAQLSLTDRTDRYWYDSSVYELSVNGTGVVYRAQVVPFPFELDGATVRIPPTPLESDTGRFTEITGELTFASSPLRPGEEAVVTRETYGQRGRGERFVFEKGGRMRIEVSGYSDGPDVRLGRWSVTGDKLRLQVDTSPLHRGIDETYTWRLDAGELALSLAPAACDQEYRRTAGARALLVPGSVDECRVESVRSFQAVGQAG